MAIARFRMGICKIRRTFLVGFEVNKGAPR